MVFFLKHFKKKKKKKEISYIVIYLNIYISNDSKKKITLHLYSY